MKPKAKNFVYTVKREILEGEPVYTCAFDKFPGICGSSKTVDAAVKDARRLLDFTIENSSSLDLSLDEPIDWEHPAKKYKDITLGEAHAICNERESCLNCPLSIETKNRRSYCFCLACSDEDGKDYKEVMDKLIQL